LRRIAPGLEEENARLKKAAEGVDA